MYNQIIAFMDYNTMKNGFMSMQQFMNDFMDNNQMDTLFSSLNSYYSIRMPVSLSLSFLFPFLFLGLGCYLNIRYHQSRMTKALTKLSNLCGQTHDTLYDVYSTYIKESLFRQAFRNLRQVESDNIGGYMKNHITSLSKAQEFVNEAQQSFSLHDDMKNEPKNQSKDGSRDGTKKESGKENSFVVRRRSPRLCASAYSSSSSYS